MAHLNEMKRHPDGEIIVGMEFSVYSMREKLRFIAVS